MKCKHCKKKLKGRQTKFCSDKCQHKERYKTKKDYYVINARKWEKNNQEKYKEIRLKANLKFRTEQRERFNKLVLKQYYKNKPKWMSRQWTYQMINRYKVPIEINKACKKCNKIDNLRLKFEVYPTNAKDIRQAIKDLKIYYLCKECRYGS